MPGRDELSRKLCEPGIVFTLKWWVSRRWKGRHSDSKIRQLRAYLDGLPPGSVVIDCGANVGVITRAAAKRSLQVHAFEPDPLAFGQLRSRVQRFRNVTLYQQAVGVERESMPLYVTPLRDLDNTISSSLVARNGLIASSTNVEVVDLIAFIRRFPFVALLKLDAEGAEFDILERLLDERLDQRIGRAFVETHEKFSADFARRLSVIRRIIGDQSISNIDLDWI
jgi:FkbM family methyltransferase